VLRDTTSRGLCVRVGPPHTNERRGGREEEVVSKEVTVGLWSLEGALSPLSR